MNAIVEVEVAGMDLSTSAVSVITTAANFLKVQTLVSTSTLRVLSQGSHSISAVAPDALNFERTLAEA